MNVEFTAKETVLGSVLTVHTDWLQRQQSDDTVEWVCLQWSGLTDPQLHGRSWHHKVASCADSLVSRGGKATMPLWHLLPQDSTPAQPVERIRQSPTQACSKNILRKVKIVKNKENLRNCHIQKT